MTVGELIENLSEYGDHIEVKGVVVTASGNEGEPTAIYAVDDDVTSKGHVTIVFDKED